MIKSRTIAAAVAALLLLTACGANTAADEVAVQIGGGIAEDANIKGCKDPGTKEIFGALGDDYLEVPAGVRNYRAKEGEVDKEQGPMTFTVKGVELRSNVQVGYAVNLDCDRPGDDELAVLEEFTRDFALKYERLHGDSWFGHLLIDYVGTPTDQALDDAAAELVSGDPSLTWRSFRSDTAVKTAFEARAGEHAQRLIETTMGGNYFCGPGSTVEGCKPLVVTVTPPTPTDPKYIELIRDEELASGQVQIAEQQKLANDARIEADKALRDTYGVDGLLEQRRLDILEKAVDSGKVTVLPMAPGVSVAVPSGPAQ